MTTENNLLNRIENSIPLPKHYLNYNKYLLNNLHSSWELASRARANGLDPSNIVDSEIALDLADRVKHLLNLPVDTRLRELLQSHTREKAALTLAGEVATGKFGFFTREDGLDLAVRTGLAVVTEGVTVAPLQGVSSVKIKENDDGTQYVAVYFAGPIRAAGGTEAALTLVIADQIRKLLGLGKYDPNGVNEDETGRILEELRIYEREVSNFQFKISDEDVRHTILHLPIEVSGVETNPVEVVLHRGLKRIETDRVRGGALRVLNDGVIGRSRKLLKIIKELSLQDWDWLEDLKNTKQQSSDTNTEKSHFTEVISGRPVLSYPKHIGGFRLRYGRSYNTGLSAVGVHPATATLLDYPFVVGTQVKVDIPGKAATISFTDCIEPPTVRLYNKSVVKIHSIQDAERVRDQTEQVLHLGDLLVSYGDFLENNTILPPSGYVEEWWCQELENSLKQRGKNIDELATLLQINPKRLTKITKDIFETYPTALEAFNLSEKLKIGLHPKYLFYWDLISIPDVNVLRNQLVVERVTPENCILTTPNILEIKLILEMIGVPHKVEDGRLIIEDDAAYSVMRTLNLGLKSYPIKGWKDTNELLTHLAGLPIRRKSSSYVGLRIGRPEKATPRRMKPPVHTLFPTGSQGGLRRDIMKAAEGTELEVELANMICERCGTHSLSAKCSNCRGPTLIVSTCRNCGRILEGVRCPACNTSGTPYSKTSLNIKSSLQKAINNVKHRPTAPLKGVQRLTNSIRIPESLEKGILRNKYDLSIYKDGTIRFDATNSPLTHFTPKQVDVSLDKLHTLGYHNDIHGKPLESENQLVELFTQDIIIPYGAAEYFLKITRFIDDLLVTFYHEKTHYNTDTIHSLIGQLVVGLAPHTSVGIVGRIVGFTNSQACLAHPYWHSAKRRDCDGDGDAIIMLMDVLLNFSKDFLPGQMGGLMDAPLIIQPIVIPSEVQRQAHNFDVTSRYSNKIYKEGTEGIQPSALKDVIETVRDRLNDESQFYGLGFTHPTNFISINRERSAYAQLETLKEKLEKQIQLATKIAAVDVNQVVTSVLNTHLVPDIQGNMTAYTSQSFRCKGCGERYRRFPLKGSCLLCGGLLNTTVSKKSVEKYLQISINLCKRFDVDKYLEERINLLSDELKTIFPIEIESQTQLTEFLKLPST